MKCVYLSTVNDGSRAAKQNEPELECESRKGRKGRRRNKVEKKWRHAESSAIKAPPVD